MSAIAQQQNSETKTKFDPRLVPSGKVYRQLFEAQVQLTDAYEKVKEKYKENPPQVKLNDNSIPLVTEGRSLRGNGFLTQEGLEWVNSEPNNNLVQNPIYLKYQNDKKNVKLTKLKKLNDRQSVYNLPDEVVPASKGSDIEQRIDSKRKIKHNETWEDMMQEIALINLNLEPEIKNIGTKLLAQLEEDDKSIENLLKVLETEDVVVNGSSTRFDELNEKLLNHTDIRKDLIDEMDKSYTKVEDDRVDKIRTIFKKYADQLFKISYLPRPELERLLDNEIQQLNNQILINKSCYAQLYSKLITVDLERERNQVFKIEARYHDWREYSLEKELINLENFVENINMLNPENEKNYELELEKEQNEINQNRFGLIESLKNLKPPESTKTSIYKWFESFRLNTSHLENINSAYANKLQMNYEESNQIIINKMEQTLEYLITNKIIDETNSKEVLEHKLLPIWSKKQKKIEDYIQQVETDLEEINQVLDKEINSLFKYLQGLAHIWDTHEIGLTKKERALQELLQDCRRDHDVDNQKREEKLDSILDQMRESSSEKDLKRLLSNVASQLDVIKAGYASFKDTQIELVKQYPNMVKDELNKYKEFILKYFNLITEDNKQEEEKQKEILDRPDSFRNILKQVLNTDRGTKFYISMRASRTGMSSDSNPDEENQTDLLDHDELIPNTKHEILNEIDSKHYLKNSFISPNLFKEIKNIIRLNFLNHLESWTDEAYLRASTIVAAKSDEIEKELDLRLHLHEPRIKRVELDVHNVRAAELIMHEERVDRHCAGIEEAIDQLQKQFLTLQNLLIDKANQNKSDVLNLEISFNNATKSLRLVHLLDQLAIQKDKHIDDIKTTLRNFRAKFDDTLSNLRNSNAKFRFSFNIFSDGGNFSAEEVDLHKKKLEKMALIIDTNETSLLKEMEKLEKKHLDEALKVMSQFQEKFKYHLVDLQFIEKITRWLNDTQIKIKSTVNESNAQAKELNKKIENFEYMIDACKFPNLDKKNVSPTDLMNYFEDLNRMVYERAYFLKCIKDENMVPINYKRLNMADSESKPTEENLANLAQTILSEETPAETVEQSPPSTGLKSKSAIENSKSNVLLKSGSKVAITDDPALEIMKTILNKNQTDSKLSEAKEFAQSLLEPQSTTQKTQTTTKASKKQSKNSRSSKLSKSSISSRIYSIAEVYKIIRERRAKTRDEMYAYYLTFGEHRHYGNDFTSKIKNILRDALEGILTNSEIYYRDLQQQNRAITRRASLKDSYPEFAEAIISKLKSYLAQCEVYQNQCLKEFRETVTKFEILISKVPELILNEIYVKILETIESNLKYIKLSNNEKLNKFDSERKKNESSLRPNLGHPNMSDKLQSLNDIELKRQEVNTQLIQDYSSKLYSTLKDNTDYFLKELSKTNENLLIKFDEILCVDDIKKHETSAEKHKTSELIKRQMAGQSLEDPEPEPLIKREKGKWRGIDAYEFFNDNKESRKFSTSINTAKTTLAHQNSSQNCFIFYEKFKLDIKDKLNSVKSIENELKTKDNKWKLYWSNSIKEIKNLYA